MPDNKWTCCICEAELAEKFHLDGRDYCADHAKDAPRPKAGGVFDETVRGTIIGQMTTRYEFWRGSTKLTECDFEHDHHAIAWFRTSHPGEFAKGAEMRALL